MTTLAVLFWISVALLVYTQVGYALLLAVLARFPHRARPRGIWHGELPRVSVIVAAHDEQDVICSRIANLRALDYPAELLEVVVASDGSTDSTAEYARATGADVVVELARGGKVHAQDAGVERSSGSLLAFSDANVTWERKALQELVAAFGDPRVGYACGHVTFVGAGGDNQEGIYWRYEMFVRRLESELSSVTAGNGAIYATRREAYMQLGADMGHDISFPFNMVKHGWRAVYAPGARATEKMSPSIETEFARKRRMVACGYPTVFRGGMLSPRGYGPLYALMIFSHRLLRYVSPFLHLIALATSIALIGHGWAYLVAAALQIALLVAAAAAPILPARLLLIARYYVLMTASLAVGLWDWMTGVPTASWERAEGTR